MTDSGVSGAGPDDYVRIGRPAEDFVPRTPIREPVPRPEPRLQPVPLDTLGAVPNPWELGLWLLGVVTGLAWVLASAIDAGDSIESAGWAALVHWFAELTLHVWPVALGAAAVLAGLDWQRRQRARQRPRVDPDE